MATERTLSIIKPDAHARNLTGAINAMIEGAGLRIIAQKPRPSGRRRTRRSFYAVHKERPFYNDLVKFMTSGPIVIQVLEADNAVQVSRRDGRHQSGQRRCRHDPQGLAESIEANSVHGSDSAENAKKEIELCFKAGRDRRLAAEANAHVGRRLYRRSIVLVNWLFVAVAPWQTRSGRPLRRQCRGGLRLRPARLRPAPDRPAHLAGDIACRHHHLFHGRIRNWRSPALRRSSFPRWPIGRSSPSPSGPLQERILVSSVVSVPLDTLAFQYLAGYLTPAAFTTEVLSKCGRRAGRLVSAQVAHGTSRRRCNAAHGAGSGMRSMWRRRSR